MGSMNYTPAQDLAIHYSGGSLLVSAAAGSGKTKVLIARALRLMCGDKDTPPIDANRLMIVTFTNAAAAELRTRLNHELTQKIQDCFADDEIEMARHLKRQQMLLECAPIGTIDSFCLDLVRKNFRALDIAPDVATGDESKLSDLREQALEEVMQNAFTNSDFCSLAQLYGKSRGDGGMAETILNIHQYARSIPNYKNWLDQCADAWKKTDSEMSLKWQKVLIEVEQKRISQAILYMKAAVLRLDQAIEEGYIEFQAMADQFSDELNQIENCETLLTNGCLTEYCEAKKQFVFKKKPIPAKAKASKTKVLTEEQLARNAVIDEIDGLAGKTLRKKGVDSFKKASDGLVPEEVLLEDYQCAAPMVLALVDAVKRFDDRYFELKKENKILDFADFEHLALSLLLAPSDEGTTAFQKSDLALELGKQIATIMVDEYQDTNDLQDAIYNCLANDEKSNLFYVGDVKQSIYGFRQANPEIFIHKIENSFRPSDANEHHKGKIANVALDRNFRSAKNVINGINTVFDGSMTKEVGGVPYRDGDGERLVVGAAESEWEGLFEYDFVVDIKGEDCNAVAKRVKDLLASGTLVRDKKGNLRPCQPEDFCILLRSRKRFSAYMEALKREGIQCAAQTAENLLDSPAVMPILSLLQVLDNPAQDVPLTAFLSGPFVGMTMEEITQLRAQKPDGSLFGALLPNYGKLVAPFVLNDQMPWGSIAGNGTARQKAEKVYAALLALQHKAAVTPVKELLQDIVAQTSYKAVVSMMPGGNQNLEALEQFLEYVAGREDTSLASLVRVINLAIKSKKGLSLTVENKVQNGSVNLMTIHGSKGLEFPIVICADTARTFNTRDTTTPVLCHRELGIGLKLKGPGGLYETIAYSAIKMKKRQDEISEELRVLYVALTRAQDRLLCFIPLKPTQKEPYGALLSDGCEVVLSNSISQASAESNCFAKWLSYAALTGDGNDVLWTMARKPAPCECIQNHVKVLIGDNDQPEQVAEEEPADFDPVLLDRLNQKISWKYHHQERTAIASKVAVTAISHPQNGVVALKRPSFAYNKQLQGAERGTALHEFMEYADFTRAAKDAKAEAERLAEEGIILPQLCQVVDYSAVKSFFSSPLYDRVCGAKQVLREYSFLTKIPAQQIGTTSLTGEDKVMLQGVVDLVLIFDDGIEIVDYKSDKMTNANEYIQAYQTQLSWYATAITRRFSPQTVKKCTIYSFTLEQEIDVPFMITI